MMPAPLVVSGSRVYFPSDGAVAACPKDGCSGNPTLFTSSGIASGMAVDTMNVYFAQYYQGVASECALAGCGNGQVTLESSGGPFGIVVDSANVYWTNIGGSVATCPIGGCNGAPTTLWMGQPGSTQADSRFIAVDDDNVYWVDDQPDYSGQVMQCPKRGQNDAGIVLANDRNQPTGIAVDEANVYWTEWGLDIIDGGGWQAAPGQVVACAKGGCDDSPNVVAANQGNPVAIAVDANNVYWTVLGLEDDQGEVLMVSK